MLFVPLLPAPAFCHAASLPAPRPLRYPCFIRRLQNYKKALQEQSALYDVATEKGKKTSLMLQDFANTSLEVKTAWTKFVTGFTDSFAENYNKALQAMGIDTQGFDNTADAAGKLGETLGKLAPMVVDIEHGFERLGPVIDRVGYIVEKVAMQIGIVYDALNQTVHGHPFDTAKIKDAMKQAIHGHLIEADKTLATSFRPLGALQSSMQGLRDVAAGPGENLDYERRKKNAEIDGEMLGTGAGKGGGTVGASPLGTTTLKNFGAYHIKGQASQHAEGGGGGGGSSSSGGAGEVYAVKNLRGIIERDLSRGPILAQRMAGIDPGRYAIRAHMETAAGVAARTAAAKPVPAVVKIDDITIEITGASDAKSVGEEVAKVLRGLGRYARTPGPNVL